MCIRDRITGESADVSKDTDKIVQMEIIYGKTEIIEQDTIPAKQINMVFGGTLVAYGKGVMVVTSTGDKTEMGRIAQNLIHEDIPTPLQQRLGKLSAKIATISGVIAAILCAYMIIKLNIKGQILSLIHISISIGYYSNMFWYSHRPSLKIRNYCIIVSKGIENKPINRK